MNIRYTTGLQLNIRNLIGQRKDLLVLVFLILLVGVLTSPLYAQIRPLGEKIEIQQFDPSKAKSDLDSLLDEVTYNKSSKTHNWTRLSVWIYTIRKGDTPLKIANRNGVDLSTLLSLNDIKEEGRWIYPGEHYKIANQKGIVHKVSRGQTLQSIVRAYREFNVELEKLCFVNDLDQSIPLKPGQKLFIPGAKLPDYEIQERLREFFALPLSGSYRVTSHCSAPGQKRRLVYGGRVIHSPHNGIDLAQPMGSRVRAPRSGRIKFAGWKGGYGKLIIMQVTGTEFGTIDIYFGHLSRINVRVGQWVTSNQVIGRVGSTGRSTGPHLHLECRQGSYVINPVAVFSSLQKRLGIRNPGWTKRRAR
jgi:murein DD-endopeptidase MepM/ murein hydrolase activator NlpD